MRSFEIEVVFVKHLFKSDLYFGHILQCFDNIDLIQKIEPLLQLNNKVLFSLLSSAKLFGSNDRLIQFFVSL